MYPLQTSLLQVLPATDTIVNNVDSARVVVSGAVQQMMADPGQFFSSMAESLIKFGFKLLGAALIYVIGRFVIKWILKFLDKYFEKRGTDATVVSFIRSLTSITLAVILVIISINALGIGTVSIAALLAAAGMAIGMALSGTLQNFAGGIMIMLFRPFKIGDYIQAQGYEGFVCELNMVSTKLRTFDNCVIILANGTLFSGNTKNFSVNPERRLEWKVDVEYGSDADKVRSVLLDIMEADKRVLRSCPDAPMVADPAVIMSSLNDSSVSFICRAWVKSEDYWAVLAGITEAIYTTLPQKGVKFPFPQLDVHMVE